MGGPIGQFSIWLGRLYGNRIRAKKWIEWAKRITDKNNKTDKRLKRIKTIKQTKRIKTDKRIKG